jgi:uncharacterized protein YozE (UPF0346 family)
MNPKKLSFYDWLSTHARSNSPIGDLADDIAADCDFPHIRSLSGLLRYLVKCKACDGAIRAAREAWEQYQHAL